MSRCFVDGVGVVVSVEALFGVAGDVLAKIPPDKADMMKHAASELENLYKIMEDVGTREMSEAQTQEYVGVFSFVSVAGTASEAPEGILGDPGHGRPWLAMAGVSQNALGGVPQTRTKKNPPCDQLRSTLHSVPTFWGFVRSKTSFWTSHGSQHPGGGQPNALLHVRGRGAERKSGMHCSHGSPIVVC